MTDGVREAFESRFAQAIGSLRVVTRSIARRTLGPMARADLRDQLDRQVQRSVQKGARVILGGRAIPGRGFFYSPTLLTDTDASMEVVAEETFGPVAPILRAGSAEDALRIANDSRYGLAAVIWSADVERARALASRMEAGSVFINGVTASDPRLPVGGVKLSGYGRELGAAGHSRAGQSAVRVDWTGSRRGDTLKRSRKLRVKCGALLKPQPNAISLIE